MPALSSKPAVDAVDRRIGQTDGRTDARALRRTAPYTMRAASKILTVVTRGHRDCVAGGDLVLQGRQTARD